MKDTGGPAFPMSALVYNEDGKDPTTIIHDGMTLRDYFAAKALLVFYEDLDGDESMHPDSIAHWCYLMADAMLKERKE
jgi:hypothetical protein